MIELSFILFFSCGFPSDPISFVKMSIFPQLNYFGSFIENQLTLPIYVYSSVTCFVPLIYISMFIQIPHGNIYCTITILKLSII